MTQGSGRGEEGEEKGSIDSLAVCPGQTWVSVYECLKLWSKAASPWL